MKNLIKPLLRFTVFIFLIFNSSMSFGQVAPVNPPAGGFAIDGGLRANTPTTPNPPFAANQGDWYPGATGSGTGGSVFDASGAAINSGTTGKAVDFQNNALDNIFTQGSKFNDYISALNWGTGTAPDKNDINNALYHISRAANNDQWVFMAGDRFSTNGTSYIDFEFLQGTVTPNAATGKFAGSGLAGGRTIGDLIISMEYTNGGSKPLVYVYRWEPTSEAVNPTYAYKLITNLNATHAFAETNRTAAETNVPYSVFGAAAPATYQQYAFVEAAVNITELLEIAGAQLCQSLNIQTLWVKTKASSSSTAALKDFMEPISVSFNFGSLSIDNPGPFCSTDETVHTLTASETGAGAQFTIDNVVQTTFKATDYSVGTHAVSYTYSGCTANAVFVINAAATANAGDDQTICEGQTATLAGSAGGGATSGTWSGGAGSFSPNATTLGAVYTPHASEIAAGFVILTLTTNDPDGSGPCGAATDNVRININPNPSVSVNSPTICASAGSATMTATPSGGTGPYSYAWTVPGGSNPGNVSSFSATVAGNYSVIVTDNKNCASGSGGGVLTINPNPTVSINSPTICASTGSATMTATPAGGTGPYSYAWTVPGGANPGNVSSFSATVEGDYSVHVTDNKNCTSTTPGSGTLTINDNPGAPAVQYNPPACDEATFSITITNVISGATYIVKNSSGGTIAGLSPASGHVAPNTDNITFTGIPAGAGYQVTVQVGSCLSTTSSCESSARLNNSGNTITTEVVTAAKAPATFLEPVAVKAFPNPFNDRVKFVVTSREAGYGTLDVMNMLGQKVKTVYKGQLNAGNQTFEMVLPKSSGTLFYIFRMNGKQVTGKLIQNN